MYSTQINNYKNDITSKIIFSPNFTMKSMTCVQVVACKMFPSKWATGSSYLILKFLYSLVIMDYRLLLILYVFTYITLNLKLLEISCFYLNIPFQL